MLSQDVWKFTPLSYRTLAPHFPSSADHYKQGIGYRWPCAILGWLVIINISIIVNDAVVILAIVNFVLVINKFYCLCHCRHERSRRLHCHPHCHCQRCCRHYDHRCPCHWRILNRLCHCRHERSRCLHCHPHCHCQRCCRHCDHRLYCPCLMSPFSLSF